MMFKGKMNRVVANNDGYDDQGKDESITNIKMR